MPSLPASCARPALTMSTFVRVCVALRHVYVVGSQNAGEGECMWNMKKHLCYPKKIMLFGHEIDMVKLHGDEDEV
eukprot:COSAG05_NODE_1754_length_4142_cov_11.518427_1_plen_75_part_00